MATTGGKRQPSSPLSSARSVIWKGRLIWSESDLRPLSVSCSASSSCQKDELATDKWPETLHLQLIPISVVNSIGSLHFRQSKSVIFHPEDADVLASALGSESAGCVHFTGVPGCRLLILLYNSVKRAFLGFVPNDQELFVDRFLEVILLQNRQMSQNEPKPEIVWQGEVMWQDKAEERIISCSISWAKEGELRPEFWPKRLVMQLLPISIINSMDRQFLRNSRTVCFRPGEEGKTDLSSVLGGESAGYVHFPGAPMSEVKVMVLLSKNDGKKSFVGLIPNDQVFFMEALRMTLRKARVKQQLEQGLVMSPEVPEVSPEKVNQQLDRVREHFECPVCYKEMQGVQIFSCSNDHWLCSVCLGDPRLTNCPLCREDFAANAPKRCYTAERIVQQIKL